MKLGIYLLAVMAVMSAGGALGQESVKIAQPPVVKDDPQPYPPAALAGGHTGTVLVKGILGTDGKFRDAEIRQSSGSDILDDAALEAIGNWTFSPALDATGNPIAIPLTANLEYTKAFDEDYRCSQFVLDSDWHDRIRGRDHRDELRVYKTLRGFSVMAARRSKASSTSNFDDQWDQTIKYCRDHPKERFKQAFFRSL